VKITKKKIEIIDTTRLKKHGAVWENEIIPHNIKLDKQDKGVFSEFCKLSMERHNPKKKNDVWWKNYEFNERSNEEYKSLRRAYGFLIHSHNTSEDKKCIFFIDQDSSKDRTDGQNGKSKILSSIRFYKKDAYQDGQRFRQGMGAGERFQFTNVDVNTKFVWIDDVKPEFKFELLFSILTGPMEVERKNKDKFVIPTSKKPKFGITTNHIIPQAGVSYDARMHIIEFGNYLSKQKSVAEPGFLKQKLGKLLPDGDYVSYDDTFVEKDWDDFFNFGFRCVLQYFNEGLVSSKTSTYKNKAIISSIEGDRGEGVVDWIDNWILTTRVKNGHHLMENGGILEDKLYEEFARSNPLLVDTSQGGNWNKARFLDAVFKWVISKEDTFYNDHKSDKGNTRSKRRWLVGKSNDQNPAILITTRQDYKMESKKPKRKTLTTHKPILEGTFFDPYDRNQSEPEGMYWSKTANRWMAADD